jgi:hypothetical protein
MNYTTLEEALEQTGLPVGLHMLCTFEIALLFSFPTQTLALFSSSFVLLQELLYNLLCVWLNLCNQQCELLFSNILA